MLLVSPLASLLASEFTRDAQKNKLIKVKCATAVQSLVDHKTRTVKSMAALLQAEARGPGRQEGWEPVI